MPEAVLEVGQFFMFLRWQLDVNVLLNDFLQGVNKTTYVM